MYFSRDVNCMRLIICVLILGRGGGGGGGRVVVYVGGF